MRFLRVIGSFFCILSIATICLLAASVFNSGLSDVMKKVGTEAIAAIKEFSEKAEINVFSEGAK